MAQRCDGRRNIQFIIIQRPVSQHFRGRNEPRCGGTSNLASFFRLLQASNKIYATSQGDHASKMATNTYDYLGKWVAH